MTSATGEPIGRFDADHPAPLHLSAGPLPDPEPSAPVPRADPAVAAPTAPPRFGQLTHASFHAADGYGGWQVKEVTGRITADEQRLLERRATGFSPAELSKLPTFLGQDEIDRLPRRLVYGPVDPARPGATAYWHAVPAGQDSSRRPGNVFTHVLLDREPDAPRPPLRPSDLLRSPAWLRPYGAQQVSAATVSGQPVPPEAGPVLDRSTVLPFLVEKALWHAGTLRGLLDAVHAAMRGGPTVVLGVVEPADADRWVAAVCHLMSPGTSRRLYFSTAEHGDGLAAARGAGLHLVVVPAPELRTVEPDGTAVLISDEDLIDGRQAVEFVDFDVELGGEQAHVTSYGSRIRATPWSVIAAAVLNASAPAGELLDRQDAIAAEVGDRGLDCAWPLAVALVEHGLDHPGTTAADVLDEALPAARMVARYAPPGIAGTRPAKLVQRLQEQALGRTTADAWTVLQGRLPREVNPRFARTVYLQRAVGDRQWLLRAGGVPLPDMLGAAGPIGDTVVAQAHATLDQLVAEVRTDRGRVPDSAAALALRLLDLLARVGLAGLLDPAWVDDVLDRLVGPVLLHPLDGPALIERVGPLGEGAQSKIVRPWLDQRIPRLPGRPGVRLVPLVLRWLFPEPPVPPPAGFAPATLVEAAAQAALVLPDPSAFRSVALAADLTTPGGPGTRAARGPGLPADAVLALLDRVEPRRLVDVLGPALLATPAGPDLDALLRRLGGAVGQPVWDTPAGRGVQQAVALRTLERSWNQAPRDGDREPAFQRFVRLLRPLVQAGEHLAPDLVASGAAADVVDRIHGSDEVAGPPLVELRRPASTWADSDTMMNLGRRVADAVRTGATSDLRLVLAAQLGDHALDGVLLGSASWQSLSPLCWTSPSGRPQRLLDHIAWLRLSELQHTDALDRLVAGARTWVEQTTGELRTGGVDPQRALDDYDHVALRWWRRVGVQDDESLKVLQRRTRWSK